MMAISLERWFSHKKSNSRLRGIEFKLTMEQVSELMKQCGITFADTGSSKGKYVLGRKNEVTGVVDEGPYEIGNCRFILWEDNIAESNVSELSSIRQRKLVANGTHMFLDGEAQRERSISSNEERVSNGTHNLLGVMPWDNIRTKNNPQQMEMWKLMPEIYSFWLETGKRGHKWLSTSVKAKYGIICNCNCLHILFRDSARYETVLEEWKLLYAIEQRAGPC